MKKKKTIRNILIAVAALVLIAAAVFFAIALKKDGHGMNLFQRAATAGTADGEKVSMIEYALTLDTIMENDTSTDFSALSAEQMKEYQEDAVEQALLAKIYVKEAKAKGIELTDEEEEACKKAAQNQIDAVVESYTKNLINNGGFSKSALEKQVASYYTSIGMNQSQYYRYCLERSRASYYMDKLDEYYESNGSDIAEEELLSFYHEFIGDVGEEYKQGQYSTNLVLYLYGYSMPLLYVPENFIFVDFLQVNMETEEEINELFNKVINGEMTFEELRDSDDNKYGYKDYLKAPYAIGEGDHGYLFSSEEAFEAAKALAVGEIGTYLVPIENTEDDGTKTVSGYTGYMFRRAEGTICENGENGIVSIDYFPGIRENMETGLRQREWTGDITYADAVYSYRGIS